MATQYTSDRHEETVEQRSEPQRLSVSAGLPQGGATIAAGKRPTAHPATYLSGKQRKAGKGTDAPRGRTTRTHPRLV